jgi:ABC-type sulfate transport system permease subunit
VGGGDHGSLVVGEGGRPLGRVGMIFRPGALSPVVAGVMFLLLGGRDCGGFTRKVEVGFASCLKVIGRW